jgi:hypothetical protein
MIRTIPLVALLAVAGCARSEDASLVRQENNQGYNLVAPVGTNGQDDREPAIGEWRASLQDNIQALEFGPMGTDPLFSLLCSGNRNVLLQRHGEAPAGQLPEMQVSRGQANARLPVTAGGTTIPMLRSEIPVDGPVAAALGAQGEPLIITLGDTAALILPASPLIADYLRSCVSAQALPTAPRGAPAGNSAAPAAQGNSAAAAATNAAQPKQ